MTKAPRYLFVLPDVECPVGGVNVTLHFVQVLREAGYDAAVVHAGPAYHYPFYDTAHRPYFYPPLAGVPGVFMGRRDRLAHLARKLMTPRKTAVNPELRIRPSDVFVVPEFWYPEYCMLFPDNRKVLFLQVVFGFCRALGRDLEAGTSLIDDFDAVVTISEATDAAARQFAGRDSYLVRQSVVRPAYDPATPKRKQIAYMPRKRREEVNILLTCAQRNPVFRDWTFRPIDGVGADEVDRILNESLIFLSFSHQEGFGLPPAEAMAAGCIVIGYTGVAGEEFFTHETGIPILDSDIAEFAAAMERTVTEYSSDSTRLDALRFHAADFMARHYNPGEMRKTLLTAWSEIEENL